MNHLIANTVTLRTTSQNTAGESIEASHLRMILRLLHKQIDTLQLLLWIVFSGAPRIRDVVTLQFTYIETKNGLISLSRKKSIRPIVFAALPPLLTLLEKRKDQLGSNTQYVFPELLFGKNTGATLQPGGQSVPACCRADEMIACARANKMLKRFCRSCGLTEAITFKSIRHHLISFWRSRGARDETLHQVCAHSPSLGLISSSCPMQDEILCLRDITWRYLNSIMQDRPDLTPKTPLEILGLLEQRLRIDAEFVASVAPKSLVRL